MRITDPKFSVIGHRPVVGICTDEEIDGFGALQAVPEAADPPVEGVLDFTHLKGEAATPAGTLSHGLSRHDSRGGAVAAAGRADGRSVADETRRTGEMLHDLNRRGIAVLAAEHDMAFIEQISERQL